MISKHTVSTLALLFIFLNVLGQETVDFHNPSFEGSSCSGCAPVPWTSCGGSPDTQPGQWNITMSPSDGNTYISLLHSGSSANGYYEGVAQLLSHCLDSGLTYEITVDAAFSPVYNTADPGDCPGSFMLVGGNSNCALQDTLWQSGPVTNTNWQTFTFSFIPDDDWCYLTFMPYYINGCSGYYNIMLDNINNLELDVTINNPSENEDIPCTYLVQGSTDTIPQSVTLSGNFTNSPTPVTFTSDTLWEAQISYGNGYTGQDTLMAIANFQNSVDSFSVIVNAIDSSLVTPPEICVVTVDSAVNKNKIIWEENSDPSIEGYEIYRETNQSGIYTSIGSAPLTSLSVFIDQSSQPDQNSNRYKIAGIDSCGRETGKSTHHQTIHMTVNQAFNGWNLIWNHYEGFSFNTYNIYRGSSPNNFTLLNSISSNNNSYSDINPPSGMLYYLVEAVNPSTCLPTRNTDNSLSNIGATFITGIENQTSPISDLQVSPNPNNGSFALSGYANNDIKGTVEIHNSLGQLILSINISATAGELSMRIDLENTSSGIYYLSLKSEEISVHKKFLIR